MRGGARGGGGATYYVSVGRDVPPKGVQFPESAWDRGIFHCAIWEGSQIYVSGKESLLV